MPRNVSGIYAVPPGTDGVPDHTIESARYNSQVHDMETDLNLPRPIIAGGTGAANAADAMVALGGELAAQGDVRNYDTFAFKSGSFFSSPGATSSPDGAAPAANYYQGICYDPAPGYNDFYLEARNLGTNVKYYRRKFAGVWQPWVRDDQLALDNSNLKVAKAGDTMTGDLTISKDLPEFMLNRPNATTAAVVTGRLNNVTRWNIFLGDGSAEPGGNAGSNFLILGYGDAGTPITASLTINRATGQITGSGTVPAGANDLVNKAYVDGTGATGLAGKVSKAGDTMSGSLGIQNFAAPPLYALPAADDMFIVHGKTNLTDGFSLSSVNAVNSVLHGIEFRANLFSFATGSVGIGKATPGAKLDVNGDIHANNTIAGTILQATQSNIFADAANSGAQPALWLRDEAATTKGLVYWDRASNSTALVNSSFVGVLVGSTGQITLGTGMRGRSGTSGAYDTNSHNFFWTGSAGQVWIDVTNVGNLTITCDYRIKKDVAPLPSTWEQVRALKPISYTGAEFTPPAEKIEHLKNVEKRTKENLPPLDPLAPMFVNDDEPQWGFLAHELQETLLKSAASGVKDAPAIVQSPNLLAICAALTRALQEAMARIEALEAK